VCILVIALVLPNLSFTVYTEDTSKENNCNCYNVFLEAILSYTSIRTIVSNLSGFVYENVMFIKYDG
jgi:hypothetical protein